MKKKFKDIQIVRKQGFDAVQKYIKKYLKEPITEPTDFFYDTAFDYDPQVHPLLFIGTIPSNWKKYIKENKQSPTLLKGKCVVQWDGKARLLLFPESGKGGKTIEIKKLNKELLKPFATARLVENMADLYPSSSSGENGSIKNALEYLQASANVMKDRYVPMKDNLTEIVDKLGDSLQDIKNTIVTDALIEEVKDASKKIKNIPFKKAIKNLESWVVGARERSIEEGEAVIETVEVLLKTMQELVEPIQNIEVNAQKIQLVQDPLKNEKIALISDDPLQSLSNKIGKSFHASALNG